MAIIHSLPPQAYTKDVLVKAVEWLQTQPPQIRDRAQSADAMVSLYLQARRRTSEWQSEAPVSGENFKSDLRNLAQDLKQFEESPAPPTAPEIHHEPVYRPPSSPPHHSASPKASWSPDPRTLSAAREIQSRLNLSSEAEAIRMLVTLGIERARELFPG